MSKLRDELSKLMDPHKNTLLGVIGLSESTIRVEDRAGYVWVRLLDNDNEVLQAYNRKVSPVYNLPVKLEFARNRYEIIDIDHSRYLDWGTDAAFLPNHAGQHSAMKNGGGGGDILWVDSRQFLPAVMLPMGRISGSQEVSISPYVFRNSAGNWLYTGNTGVTIPTSTTPTGSVIYLVAIKDSDGSINLHAGPPYPNFVTGTADFIKHLPTYSGSSNDLIIGAVEMTTTGTLISWDNILDTRQFFGGGGGGSSPSTGTTSYLTLYNSGTSLGSITGIDFYGFSVGITGTKGNIVSIGGISTGTADIGDVEGPSGSVDNRIAVFNGTTGKLIKDGGKTIAEIDLVKMHHSQAVFTIEGIVSTVGTKPIRIYTPYVGTGATIEEVFLSCNSVPATTPIRMNVYKNGSTIFNATPYIQLNTGTYTASKTTDFVTTSLFKDDYLTVGVVQGDTNAADMSLHIRYKWTFTGV